MQPVWTAVDVYADYRKQSSGAHFKAANSTVGVIQTEPLPGGRSGRRLRSSSLPKSPLQNRRCLQRCWSAACGCCGGHLPASSSAGVVVRSAPSCGACTAVVVRAAGRMLPFAWTQRAAGMTADPAGAKTAVGGSCSREKSFARRCEVRRHLFPL